MPYHPGHVEAIKDHLSKADLWKHTRLEFIAGWEQRGYLPFHPRAFMKHHDASAKPSPGQELAQQKRLSAMHAFGRPGLPGPIVQEDLSRFIPDYGKFVLTVLAAGAANHPGLPDADGFRGLTGRANFVGLEVCNTGTGSEEWPLIQLEIASACSAGWLAYLALDASWECQHKEYASHRKIDMWCCDRNGNVKGDRERERTQSILDGGVVDMPLTIEDADLVVQRLLERGIGSHGPFANVIEGIHINAGIVRELEDEILGLPAAVKAELGEGGADAAQVVAAVVQALARLRLTTDPS